MSLLTNKFNYKELTRDSVNGKRLYSCPDGSRVPSVTTILDKTKPPEKMKALMEWRNRVGHEKAQQITTEAASRGTRMHKYLEEFVKTGTMPAPGTNPYSHQSHAMAKTVVNEGLVHVNEIWGVEVSLYYPGLYAGTSDGVGVHKSDDAIIDYKQSNKAKKEEWIEDYYLQLAAYALAHNEIYKTNIRKGVVLMCVKPDLDEKLSIISEPIYQEFILSPSKFDFWANKWWDRVEQYYHEN